MLLLLLVLGFLLPSNISTTRTDVDPIYPVKKKWIIEKESKRSSKLLIKLNIEHEALITKNDVPACCSVMEPIVETMDCVCDMLGLNSKKQIGPKIYPLQRRKDIIQLQKEDGKGGFVKEWVNHQYMSYVNYNDLIHYTVEGDSRGSHILRTHLQRKLDEGSAQIIHKTDSRGLVYINYKFDVKHNLKPKSTRNVFNHYEHFTEYMQKGIARPRLDRIQLQGLENMNKWFDWAKAKQREEDIEAYQDKQRRIKEQQNRKMKEERISRLEAIGENEAKKHSLVKNVLRTVSAMREYNNDEF